MLVEKERAVSACSHENLAGALEGQHCVYRGVLKVFGSGHFFNQRCFGVEPKDSRLCAQEDVGGICEHRRQACAVGESNHLRDVQFLVEANQFVARGYPHFAVGGYCRGFYVAPVELEAWNQEVVCGVDFIEAVVAVGVEFSAVGYETSVVAFGVLLLGFYGVAGEFIGMSSLCSDSAGGGHPQGSVAIEEGGYVVGRYCGGVGFVGGEYVVAVPFVAAKAV